MCKKIITNPRSLFLAGVESNEEYEPGIYATVGGGTGTPTAKESLNMIGCFGKVGILYFCLSINSLDFSANRIA